MADDFSDVVPADVTGDTQSIEVTTKAGNTYTEYASADGIQQAQNQLNHYEAAQGADAAAAMQDQVSVDSDKADIANVEKKINKHETAALDAELRTDQANLHTATAALNLDNAKQNAAGYDVNQFSGAVTKLQGMYSSEQQAAAAAAAAATTTPTSSSPSASATNPNAPTSGTAISGTEPVMGASTGTTAAGSGSSSNPSGSDASASGTNGVSAPEGGAYADQPGRAPIHSTSLHSDTGSTASATSTVIGGPNPGGLASPQNNAPGGSAANDNGSTYTVKAGDSLSSIAAAKGISLSELESANPKITNPSLIYPNEKIHIPGGAQSPTASVVSSSDPVTTASQPPTSTLTKIKRIFGGGSSSATAPAPAQNTVPAPDPTAAPVNVALKEGSVTLKTDSQAQGLINQYQAEESSGLTSLHRDNAEVAAAQQAVQHDQAAINTINKDMPSEEYVFNWNKKHGTEKAINASLTAVNNSYEALQSDKAKLKTDEGNLGAAQAAQTSDESKYGAGGSVAFDVKALTDGKATLDHEEAILMTKAGK